MATESSQEFRCAAVPPNDSVGSKSSAGVVAGPPPLPHGNLKNWEGIFVLRDQMRRHSGDSFQMCAVMAGRSTNPSLMCPSSFQILTRARAHHLSSLFSFLFLIVQFLFQLSGLLLKNQNASRLLIWLKSQADHKLHPQFVCRLLCFRLPQCKHKN